VGLEKEEIIKEIKKTEEVLLDYQETDPIIRPPYGSHDALVDGTVAELGYRQVLWNVDTEDWKRKPDGWVRYGLEQISRRRDCIILMHDIHATTIVHLDHFIRKIRDMGNINFEKPSSLPTTY
jgi:peptidoglycan/xylan/chitin deacetylase (PgdA/CDA1 family)